MKTVRAPSPSRRLLTYGSQCLDEDDRRAVLEALDSDWLTQGPAVERFEHALAARFGVRHAVVCSNGTAALHLAAVALDWTAGDVVIVPAITFVASANCAAYVGAEPYFVDVTEDTLAIDPDEVESAITRLRAAGRKVRGIVGVDFAGHAADWTALRRIADSHGVRLLDDACHAMGATYGGVKVGSCMDPEISTLSFHPVKHITTGEGGAVLTNDDALADRAAVLRTHGIVRGERAVAGWEGPWHHDMTALGYNYRLTDVQSALGLSQLSKLDRFVARRREVARLYDELLAGDEIFAPPQVRDGYEHAYHLYVVRAPFRARGDRRAFFGRCLAKGVQLQVHYRPVPLNSYYRDRVPPGTLESIPVSLGYYEKCFSIPIYPDLTDDDAAYVVEVLRSSWAA